MPLGFEERPTLVPVFSNGKEYNEDFHLLEKKGDTTAENFKTGSKRDSKMKRENGEKASWIK